MTEEDALEELEQDRRQQLVDRAAAGVRPAPDLRDDGDAPDQPDLGKST